MSYSSSSQNSPNNKNSPSNKNYRLNSINKSNSKPQSPSKLNYKEDNEDLIRRKFKNIINNIIKVITSIETELNSIDYLNIFNLKSNIYEVNNNDYREISQLVKSFEDQLKILKYTLNKFNKLLNNLNELEKSLVNEFNLTYNLKGYQYTFLNPFFNYSTLSTLCEF